MKNSYLGPEFSDSQIESELEKGKPALSQTGTSAAARCRGRTDCSGQCYGLVSGTHGMGTAGAGQSFDRGPSRAAGHERHVSMPASSIASGSVRLRLRFWWNGRASISSTTILRRSCCMFTRSVRRNATQLCAVNHVDDTGRLQTVSREENPLYYDLIQAFERKTGIPVILNTSFNENEPIVCKPSEAIDCFKRTRMDASGDRSVSGS